MVDSVNSLGTTGIEATAQKSGASLAADFDAFLLLLTTQLKNQDPLSPLEPTEFTSQLVQFASVEQQIKTNSNMETLLGVQNASLAASIIGFVGTDVEAWGNQVPLQNGQAKFTYDLSASAKNVVITISDDAGKLVMTKAGELGGGLHEFVWDGKNGDGVQQPDGAYKVSVTPVGFDDTPIDATITVFGHVTGVSLADGTTLTAGTVQIPLDQVQKIKEAGSN